MNEKHESLILKELGAILTVALGYLVGMAIMTCLLGLLFAPILYPVLNKNLLRIASGRDNVTVEEMLAARKALVTLQLVLWIVAIISWVVFATITIKYDWF